MDHVPFECYRRSDFQISGACVAHFPYSFQFVRYAQRRRTSNNADGPEREVALVEPVTRRDAHPTEKLTLNLCNAAATLHDNTFQRDAHEGPDAS